MGDYLLGSGSFSDAQFSSPLESNNRVISPKVETDLNPDDQTADDIGKWINRLRDVGTKDTSTIVDEHVHGQTVLSSPSQSLGVPHYDHDQDQHLAGLFAPEERLHDVASVPSSEHNVYTVVGTPESRVDDFGTVASEYGDSNRWTDISALRNLVRTDSDSIDSRNQGSFLDTSSNGNVLSPMLLPVAAVATDQLDSKKKHDDDVEKLTEFGNEYQHRAPEKPRDMKPTHSLSRRSHHDSHQYSHQNKTFISV